jgi:hypothetical protein
VVAQWIVLRQRIVGVRRFVVAAVVGVRQVVEAAFLLVLPLRVANTLLEQVLQILHRRSKLRHLRVSVCRFKQAALILVAHLVVSGELGAKLFRQIQQLLGVMRVLVSFGVQHVEGLAVVLVPGGRSGLVEMVGLGAFPVEGGGFGTGGEE